MGEVEGMDVSVNLLFLKFNLLENLLVKLGNFQLTNKLLFQYWSNCQKYTSYNYWYDSFNFNLKKKRTTYTLCVQVLPDYRINKETKRAIFYYALKKGKKEYQPYQREIVLSYDLAAVIFIVITRFNSDI